MRSLGSDGELIIDDDLKAKLMENPYSADIGELNRRILRFADKLTMQAHTTTQEYIDELKEAGMSEAMIHDIVQVAAYFNYINRLADGLGVELEDES